MDGPWSEAALCWFYQPGAGRVQWLEAVTIASHLWLLPLLSERSEYRKKPWAMMQGKVRDIDVIGHLKHLGSKGLGSSIQTQIVVGAVHN